MKAGLFTFSRTKRLRSCARVRCVPAARPLLKQFRVSMWAGKRLPESAYFKNRRASFPATI